MSTKILICNCKNLFQDTTYGDKHRVHNWAAKRESWVCVVCGNPKKGKKET